MTSSGMVMIKILFWGSITLIVASYFLYPIAIFIIAKLMRMKPLIEDIEPFISMIIPMHNEEKVVKDKIKNILSLDYPKDKLEVIFALDCCMDRTKELLTTFHIDGMRILDINERKGKVAVLNSAVKQAKGSIIVFSDANSMHRKDALKKLIRNFADEKVGCVAGKLVYTDTDATSVGKGENLYWKYEDFIKRQESRLGRLLVTNGSIQAVRKEVYPYPDPDIADDFSIPLLIQVKGHKVLYEPEAIVTEIATQSLKEEFAQKARIISQGIRGAIRLRKDLLRLNFLSMFEMIFHKILRWFVPFLMVAVFFTNAVLIKERFYLYIFSVQAVFYALALIGFIFRNRSKIKIFYVPFYVCLVNFASLAAFYRVANSRETHIWDKADSTRIRLYEDISYR